MVEIKVPELGESIQEVQISQWLKKEGEWVEKDDDLVELESEKAAQSLPAPVSGILKKIALPPGEFATIGTVIGELDESASPESASSGSSNSAAEPAVEAAAPETSSGQPTATAVMPAAERMLEEYKISADKVVPTGPGGRLLKEDVLAYVEKHNLRPGKGES
ncbi:MAG: biotin/lipoyl-containing protein, partial [Planctomycetota bacterium]|nr:biotin/lipoyl-containing protein [Planctomycetota bacterium]